MTKKQTKAESVIHEFYLREDMEDMYQQLGFKMSVKISHQAAAMFTCIANRFGVNRFDVVAPILEKAATEMFESLNSVDRDLIAKLADEETTRLLHNDGMTQVNFVTGENVPLNINTWGRIHEHLQDQSLAKFASESSGSTDDKEPKK
jgi:hypothetical protein